MNKKSLVFAILHIFGLRRIVERKFWENIILLLVCLLGLITFSQFIWEKAILEISEYTRRERKREI